MEISLVRVLVVEDSVRRFISSTLGKRPELQIVCEVSDGLEADNGGTTLHWRQAYQGESGMS